MLHRWIRLLAQAFFVAIIIVAAAVLSRGIYLQVVQPPAAELEDVSDIDRSTLGCPAPRWEQKARSDGSSEPEATRPAGCLES